MSATISSETSLELEELLRQIIELLDDSPVRFDSRSRTAESGIAVILDLQIDGVPYQLIRIPESGAPPGKKHPAALSPREREIVRLVAKGLPNKVIAEVLDISLWTVATHLRRVFSKLSAGTRAEMVAKWFEQERWLEPSSSELERATHR